MIIPRIKHEHLTGEAFEISRTFTFFADAFQPQLLKLFGLFLPQCAPVALESESGIAKGQRVDMVIEKVAGSAGHEEAYSIFSCNGKIRICYVSYIGLRNALAALCQMISVRGEALLVPSVEVRDFPAANHRGIMLDLGRGVKDFEQLKADMVLAAKARMNILHLHLCDAEVIALRLESVPEQVPGSIYPPDAYSKEQIRELCKLAEVLALEVIPEFDMPAHAERLLKAFPEMACEGDHSGRESSWVVCAGNERTYQVYEKIIQEITELFPGRYFHIGGDELEFADCPEMHQLCHWNECPVCKKRMQEAGLKDRQELFYYFVKRIYAMVKQCRRTMIMWSDQLDCQRGRQLPEDIVMQFWRVAGRGRGPVEGCSMDRQLSLGYRLINSCFTETYLDFEEYLSVESIRTWRWDKRPECSPEHAKNIIGSELCAWEYGNEKDYPHYSATLPSAIFLMADKLWNGDDLPYSEEYAKALTKAVLGSAIPEDFNVFACIGSLLPPRNSQPVYLEQVNCPEEVLQQIRSVLSQEDNFSKRDWTRAQVYGNCAEFVISQRKKDQTFFGQML